MLRSKIGIDLVWGGGFDGVMVEKGESFERKWLNVRIERAWMDERLEMQMFGLQSVAHERFSKLGGF